MKALIPAKRLSSRVPDKNWRPFYGTKSLTQIKIEQLLQVFQATDIYISCDDEQMAPIAKEYGINFLLRPAELASDTTPWPDALQGIIAATPFDDEHDIAWVEVINPLFDDYAGMCHAWGYARSEGYDSLVLAAPFNKFLLRPDGRPYNFLPGKWHVASQGLEPLFIWDSACIMKKRNAIYYSYPIGRKPFLYSTGANYIDIDTMDEFVGAQNLYAAKMSRA